MFACFVGIGQGGNWLTMSGDEKLELPSAHLQQPQCHLKAIGTSINAADGYDRYHAIGRWHLRLLQLKFVSYRPAIGGHRHVQHHRYH